MEIILYEIWYSGTMDHLVIMFKFSLLILGSKINKEAHKWTKAFPQEPGTTNSSVSAVRNSKAT